MKRPLLILLMLISWLTEAQTLDQQQLTINGIVTYSLTFTPFVGQTFTAGKSGLLSQVTLNLFDNNGASHVATVTIHPVDANNGRPVQTTILASTTATVSGSTATDYTFNFTQPTAVASGTMYAIAISCPPNTMGRAAYNYMGNDYSRGAYFYTSYSSPSNIFSYYPYDFYFRTYLTNVLPVNLISFTARPFQQAALLEWQTAQETNVDHFEIYRSPDGRSFERIGQTKAVGTATTQQQYTFVDETVTGLLYYRLRSVDTDGSYSESTIIKFRPELTVMTLRARPNPAESGSVIDIDGEFTSEQISVCDFAGRAVPMSILKTGSGRTQLSINSLKTGQYILKAISQTGQQVQSLLVK